MTLPRPIVTRPIATLFVALVAMTIATTASPARAQLETARSALADADFERAERAFTRALETDALSRDELIAIFEGRAMSRFAISGDDDPVSAREDLVALASLDPEHVLPPEAPPPLVESFARVPRERLSAELRWDDADGGEVGLRVVVRNDPARLTRGARIHTRTPGDDGWLVREGSSVEVPLAAGDALEVWVEVLGPGGAVLAQEGSPDAPRTRGSGARSSLADPSAGSDDTLLWIGVGVGAAVVLGLAIGLGVGLGSAQSELTQPAPPILIGF